MVGVRERRATADVRREAGDGAARKPHVALRPSLSPDVSARGRQARVWALRHRLLRPASYTPRQ